MATKLEPIVTYVSPDEKRQIERKASGDTLSNYVRSKLGLEPLKRGRQNKQSAKDEPSGTLAVKVLAPVDYGAAKGDTLRVAKADKETVRASDYGRTIRHKGDNKR